MKFPRFLFAATAAAATVATGLALTPAAVAAGPVRPEHVYAPYFQTYLPGSLSAVARQSGARFLTLAFVQSAGKKGASACSITWNGDRSQPISRGRYRADIARLRATGGNVIASFGGFSADQGGTEIADSCHSVRAIARAYEQLITVYGVHRLDMDVEANSLLNVKGIDRRNKAIVLVEHWARCRHIRLWIQYTLGVEPTGFDQNTMGILRDAVRTGARVDSVNLMVFDYYLTPEHRPLNMGKLAIESAISVHRQLARVYPKLNTRQLWRMLGFTMMSGIDDFPGKTEVTRLSDTRVILDFAFANRMDFLSIWAIQRDNGGCPGAIGSNTCSGIKQRPWAFSHLLEPFTR